jgi:hypothetical protein
MAEMQCFVPKAPPRRYRHVSLVNVGFVLTYPVVEQARVAAPTKVPLPDDDGLVGGLADLGLPVAQPFSDDPTGCAEAGRRDLVGLVRHDPQRQPKDAAYVVPWCPSRSGS